MKKYFVAFLIACVGLWGLRGLVVDCATERCGVAFGCSVSDFGIHENCCGPAADDLFLALSDSCCANGIEECPLTAIVNRCSIDSVACLMCRASGDSLFETTTVASLNTHPRLALPKVVEQVDAFAFYLKEPRANLFVSLHTSYPPLSHSFAVERYASVENWKTVCLML